MALHRFGTVGAPGALVVVPVHLPRCHCAFDAHFGSAGVAVGLHAHYLVSLILASLTRIALDAVTSSGVFLLRCDSHGSTFARRRTGLEETSLPDYRCPATLIWYFRVEERESVE